MNYQERTPSALSQIESVFTGLTDGRVTPQRMRKAIVISGLVLLVVIGLLVGFNIFRNSMIKSFLANNTPPPVSVNFETVKISNVPQNLTAIGSVSAIHQVTIAPEVSGKVTSISFVPGTAVKKGDVIAKLNDATEQADLATARAQASLAAVTLKRSEELLAKGSISQATYDQKQSEYTSANAAIARAEAMIGKKTLRAPFDGVLGVRQSEVGHYLEPGKAMVTLTDVQNLYIDFTLPEQARPVLTQGQNIDFTVDAYPGKTFSAILAVIDPQVNTSTRTIRMQAVAENKDGQLMPGMFANLKVELPAATDKLTIPETALDYSLYGNSVYVIQNSNDKDAKGQPVLTAKRTQVTVGETIDGRIVVETGLKANERIVTTGLSKLFDGAHLALNDTPTLVKPAEPPRE
ncbi:MAG: efflux RND transporter periplasmic adaptor subunit [Rhodospirillaceae bacterium]|nr:efflux RND transporter periplasmic adaptor subunit [Rhodospirillaceae bacterium]